MSQEKRIPNKRCLDQQGDWSERGRMVEEVREIGRGLILYMANSFGYYNLCKFFVTNQGAKNQITGSLTKPKTFGEVSVGVHLVSPNSHIEVLTPM